jgi:hypothetical protein
MLWAGHIASMEKMRIILWLEHLKEGDHVKDLVVVGRIILKCTVKKQFWMTWNGFIWHKTGRITVLLEHCD